MNTENLLLLGVIGVGAWILFGSTTRTNNPTAAAGTGTIYVPPQQAIPVSGGWPSPSAPGASAWGAIPPQPTDAQQAAAIIGSIGTLAAGVGSIISAANEG